MPCKNKQIPTKKLIKSPVVQRLSHYFFIRWENDFYYDILIIYKAFPHILSSIKGLECRLLHPFYKTRKQAMGKSSEPDLNPVPLLLFSLVTGL